MSVEKPAARDPASVAPSGFAISSAAFAQEQLYTNGGLNYSLRGYGAVGSNQQAAGAAQINGEGLQTSRLLICQTHFETSLKACFFLNWQEVKLCSLVLC